MQDTQVAAPAQPATVDVSWTASEFVDRQKPAGWYALVVGASVVLIGGIYFLSRDLFSVGILGAAAIAFMILAARKPRVLQYAISNQAIQVGQRFFPIGHFRSFAIVEEGAIHSIMVLPLKRFMPPLNIYFAPEDEKHIVKILGNYLPQEARQQDAVDKLMSKIRF